MDAESLETLEAWQDSDDHDRRIDDDMRQWCRYITERYGSVSRFLAATRKCNQAREAGLTDMYKVYHFVADMEVARVWTRTLKEGL